MVLMNLGAALLSLRVLRNWTINWETELSLTSVFGHSFSIILSRVTHWPWCSINSNNKAICLASIACHCPEILIFSVAGSIKTSFTKIRDICKISKYLILWSYRKVMVKFVIKAYIVLHITRSILNPIQLFLSLVFWLGWLINWTTPHPGRWGVIFIIF